MPDITALPHTATEPGVHRMVGNLTSGQVRCLNINVPGVTVDLAGWTMTSAGTSSPTGDDWLRVNASDFTLHGNLNNPASPGTVANLKNARAQLGAANVVLDNVRMFFKWKASTGSGRWGHHLRGTASGSTIGGGGGNRSYGGAIRNCELIWDNGEPGNVAYENVQGAFEGIELKNFRIHHNTLIARNWSLGDPWSSSPYKWNRARWIESENIGFDNNTMIVEASAEYSELFAGWNDQDNYLNNNTFISRAPRGRMIQCDSGTYDWFIEDNLFLIESPFFYGGELVRCWSTRKDGSSPPEDAPARHMVRHNDFDLTAAPSGAVCVSLNDTGTVKDMTVTKNKLIGPSGRIGFQSGAGHDNTVVSCNVLSGGMSVGTFVSGITVQNNSWQNSNTCQNDAGIRSGTGGPPPPESRLVGVGIALTKSDVAVFIQSREAAAGLGMDVNAGYVISMSEAVGLGIDVIPAQVFVPGAGPLRAPPGLSVAGQRSLARRLRNSGRI